jgi:four helix bundle protein
LNSIPTYADLKAWQEAMALATEVFRHTRNYPLGEIAALMSDTRRSAAAIAAAIAEGWARRSSNKEFKASLLDARAALMQLETYLIIGHRLEYLGREEMDEVWPLTQSTGEALGSLMRTI